MILGASVKPNQNNAYTKINTKHTLKRYNKTISANLTKIPAKKVHYILKIITSLLNVFILLQVTLAARKAFKIRVSTVIFARSRISHEKIMESPFANDWLSFTLAGCGWLWLFLDGSGYSWMALGGLKIVNKQFVMGQKKVAL